MYPNFEVEPVEPFKASFLEDPEPASAQTRPETIRTISFSNLMVNAFTSFLV